MPGRLSLKATVRGRVQGVFFRAFVESHARELGVTGYVRNVRDGSVEVLAEGERIGLEQLISLLKQGPPAARVSDVEIGWDLASGSFTDFTVR